MVPRLLSITPVRYVGRISYGLYIWHWPIFIWLNHERTGLFGFELFAVRVLMTFAVSVVSFHLVERPIRMGTFVSQWRAWLVVPASVGVVVVALVAATTGTTAVASPTPPGPAGPTGAGGASTTTSLPPASAPPVRVLVFGDSVAETLGWGLSVPKEEQKYDFVLSNEGILGCGVVDGSEVELLGARAATPSACDGTPLVPGEPENKQPWPFQWLGALNEVRPNVGVLLAGRWEVVDREYKGKWTNILNPQFAAYVKAQLEEASKLVTMSGAHMVFLTAPCMNEGEQPDGSPWPESNPARLTVYNRLVREVAAENPQTDSVVDLFGAVCPKGNYATSVDGVAVRASDGIHFSYAAGEVLAPALMPGIIAAGRAQMAQAAAASATTTNGPGTIPSVPSVPSTSVTSTSVP
jgi:hypothetical protein